MSDRRYDTDEHNADYERGHEDERTEILRYLRFWGASRSVLNLAKDIELGVHLAGELVDCDE